MTEQEQQELEMLRKEKRQRTQRMLSLYLRYIPFAACHAMLLHTQQYHSHRHKKDAAYIPRRDACPLVQPSGSGKVHQQYYRCHRTIHILQGRSHGCVQIPSTDRSAHQCRHIQYRHGDVLPVVYDQPYRRHLHFRQRQQKHGCNRHDDAQPYHDLQVGQLIRQF